MRTLTISPEQIKAALKRQQITYGQVARLAGVSWFMVWAVINRRKTSAKVMQAIAKLT